MIKLTEEQRSQPVSFIDGNGRGSYFAAQTVLLLSQGKDEQFVAKVMYCTPEEVKEVERVFQIGGVEAVVNFKG